MSIKVSVILIAYNQEDYIEETVRSIAGQETGFEFEIIVGDDCSSDRTREILISLQKEFVNLRLLFHEKNLGIVRNYMAVYNAAEGDFVSSLGGDDYYIDAHKLQKQYNFLKNNSEYSLCATSYKMLKVDSNTFEDQMFKDEDLNKEKLWTQNPIAACTVMFRRSLIPKLEPEFKDVPVEDWVLWNRYANLGKVRLMSDVTGVYRIHSRSAYSSISYASRLLWRFKTRLYIKEHISKENDKEFVETVKNWDKTIICSEDLTKDDKIFFYNQLKIMGYRWKMGVRFLMMFNIRISRSLLWRYL